MVHAIDACRMIVLAAATWLPLTCSAQTTLPRLPRDDLLIYRDQEGRLRRVDSIGDWSQRRSAVLEAMQQVMGRFPGDETARPKWDGRILEEVDCGTYVRRRIAYPSEPGNHVPAYLLIPKSVIEEGRMAPAVLCLHPTDNQFGNKVVVGLGGKPHRQYAAELADRGFVTLAPAYPLLADYQPDLDALGYQSGTMKAIWDNVRGLDLLESLPFVQTGGLGVIGHSLGGHNGIYTAVFDQRIKVIVSSCGFDSYVDYMDGRIEGWTSKRYMPQLLQYRDRLQEIPFDFHELIAAIAPRHCFISAPLGDSNFKADSVDRIVLSASEIYRLHDASDRLQVVHPDCEHDFPDEARFAAYQLLENVLKQTTQAD